jgi:hypothetical protein
MQGAWLMASEENEEAVPSSGQSAGQRSGNSEIDLITLVVIYMYLQPLPLEWLRWTLFYSITYNSNSSRISLAGARNGNSGVR